MCLDYNHYHLYIELLKQCLYGCLKSLTMLVFKSVSRFKANCFYCTLGMGRIILLTNDKFAWVNVYTFVVVIFPLYFAFPFKTHTTKRNLVVCNTDVQKSFKVYIYVYEYAIKQL